MKENRMVSLPASSSHSPYSLKITKEKLYKKKNNSGNKYEDISRD
jgi:hypothetical protein